MSLSTNMPDAEYHKHPALSFSGAKLLLPPSCPAIYRYTMDNPRKSKPAWDFGHGAHKAVLGVGEPIRYIDAKDWRTKAAQQAQEDAIAAGEIPLLRKDEGVIEGMVAALRAHPIASRLLAPGTGKPEQSIFWTDEDSGVDLRGRLDWLPDVRPGRRLVIPDYKTAISAEPEAFSKSAASYAYHQQAAFYIDGVRALELDGDPAFVFVVQSKEPPYVVSVVELDGDAIRIGRGLNRRAIRIFQQCCVSGVWPAYSSDVELVSLPVYYSRQHEEIHA